MITIMVADMPSPLEAAVTVQDAVVEARSQGRIPLPAKVRTHVMDESVTVTIAGLGNRFLFGDWSPGGDAEHDMVPVHRFTGEALELWRRIYLIGMAEMPHLRPDTPCYRLLVWLMSEAESRQVRSLPQGVLGIFGGDQVPR